MNKITTKKIFMVSFFCIALITFALHLPATCYAEVRIEASPNIINIDGQRWGEIRIFTNLSYATYRDSEVFIYINPMGDEARESIANIALGRDSWGNLILRFQLEDLLEQQNLLNIDDYNTFQVVVIKNEVEIIGQDDDVFVMDKKGS